MTIVKTLVLATMAAASVSAATSHNKTNSTHNDTMPGPPTYFDYFVAYNDSHTCVNGSTTRPFNHQIRGVNMGGWMELEPWITPSLFYQFLGGNENNTAMDFYTFCEKLGPEEANKQLHRHWKTWVTPAIVQELADSGINSVRLPVGDFIFNPYGPYGMFNNCLVFLHCIVG